MIAYYTICEERIADPVKTKLRTESCPLQIDELATVSRAFWGSGETNVGVIYMRGCDNNPGDDLAKHLTTDCLKAYCGVGTRV